MREFCHKHGEGQKWYLRAENYSDDLLSDLRRRKFIADFFSLSQKSPGLVERLGNLQIMPGLVKSAAVAHKVSRWKKLHYGQVLPIEDVARVFGVVSNVVRFPCYSATLISALNNGFAMG